MRKELTDYCEISDEGKILGMTVPIVKPVGWTSFDVVRKARGITRMKKVGHSGTLDPFAGGLLVLGFGSHTRRLDVTKHAMKTYRVSVVLGIETDTYDRTGAVLAEKTDFAEFDKYALEATLGKFTGQISQVPPMYSARKIAGKALYKYAREGKTIERESRTVIVEQIRILDYRHPVLDLEIFCGPGTYIRSIAHDLGRELNCGAHAAELTRLAVGHYTLDEAFSLEEFTDAWKLLAA